MELVNTNYFNIVFNLLQVLLKLTYGVHKMNDLDLSKIKTELRIDSDGKSYCGLRGAARLCGISVQTLSEHFTDRETPSKLAQVLLDKQFEVSGFGSSGIPDIALALIIEYYAFDSKVKSETALNSYRAFASIGIRAWIKSERFFICCN